MLTWERSIFLAFMVCTFRAAGPWEISTTNFLLHPDTRVSITGQKNKMKRPTINPATHRTTRFGKFLKMTYNAVLYVDIIPACDTFQKLNLNAN